MPEPEPTSGATSPLPVADSYLPRHGDIRYAVRNYDLSLDYRVATNHLTASATLTIEVLTDVADLALDLYGLHPRQVDRGFELFRFDLQKAPLFQFSDNCLYSSDVVLRKQRSS